MVPARFDPYGQLPLKLAVFTKIGFQNVAQTSFKFFSILRGRMTQNQNIFRRNVS